MDKLQNLLNGHPETIILSITEHWKSKEHICQLGLRNFKLVASVCRDEGKYEGSAVYVSNKVHAKQCNNISHMSVMGELEWSAAEFVLNENAVIVLSVYRPPNQPLLFFNLLEITLFSLKEISVLKWKVITLLKIDFSRRLIPMRLKQS